MASYQGGKGVGVPARHEAGQQFSICHAGPVRPEIGQDVLDDSVQRAGHFASSSHYLRNGPF
jgi:hypothetical protein